MSSLRWTEAAQDDLDSIFAYIVNDNPAAALELEDRFHRQAEHLLTFPEIGRVGRSVETRELVIQHSPYILVYRLRYDTVFVLRILHGARRWPDHFNE